MESSSFYVTLPSNASMDFYSNNTAANYTIRMPRTFYLQGKYEVALAEIQYPHTWSTMSPDLEYFVCTRPRGDDQYHCSKIPPAFYKTVQVLLDEINRCIAVRVEKDVVTLHYHETTRRVYVLTTEDYEIAFNEPLAQMLGFEWIFPHDPWYYNFSMAEKKEDLRHGFYTLYIYCSICEAQVVGDYYVPLIRTVAIEGEDGDLIMKTFNDPHYVPVNTSKFDTIEINIKKDTGEDVAFESGKVLCKLHFRQKAL